MDGVTHLPTAPRALVVTAHPDPGSLTHRAARTLVDLLDPTVTGVAHLAQEGFDPRFTAADRRTYLGRAEPVDAVRAEQRRLDAVDHVVLVFPVHWWSFPALLKGWVDRVFIADWAFGVDPTGTIDPRLGHLTMHLLPVAGASAGSWARRGYEQALRTQVEVGLVDYCGMRRGVTAFVHDSEQEDAAATGARVRSAAREIAGSINAPVGAEGR